MCIIRHYGIVGNSSLKLPQTVVYMDRQHALSESLIISGIITQSHRLMGTVHFTVSRTQCQSLPLPCANVLIPNNYTHDKTSILCIMIISKHVLDARICLDFMHLHYLGNYIFHICIKYAHQTFFYYVSCQRIV